MEPNIYTISEFPDKHHTVIQIYPHNNTITHVIVYYINDDYVFRFNPYDGTCNFNYSRSKPTAEQILELGTDDYALTIVNHIQRYMKLYNFEKIKELINNHTLSDKEKISFKDYLIEPEFKLKFVD